MKSSLTAICLVALGFIVTGCAAEPGVAADPDAEASVGTHELTGGDGITLHGTDDDDLSINLKVADGVQERTKNQRFIRLTAKRGSKEFGMWCTGAGQLGDTLGTAQHIECSEYASTVSHDDDASFSIELSKRGSSYEISSIESFGEDAFDDRLAILSTERIVPDSIALTAERGAGSVADPFTMIAGVGTRLEGLLGSKIASDGAAPLPVLSLRYSLSFEMEISTRLYVTDLLGDPVSTDKVSVLKTPGTLSSGLATASVVRDRVLDRIR